MLGLAEIKPIDEQAFARGFISYTWLGKEDFEKDLQRAIEDTAALPRNYQDEFSLLGDTIEELSSWHGFDKKDEKLEERER